MRKLLICLLFLKLPVLNTYSQSIAVNTDGSQADPSAMLEIKSASKGTLITRMLEAERTAIASPATGLLVYQTDGLSGYYYNSGTPAIPAWQKLSSDKTTVAFSSNYNSASGQAFAAGSYIKIQFNAEEFDEAGNFIPGSTSEFTAPSAGIYHFDAVATLVGSNGARYDVSFFVNGVQKRNTLLYMTNGLISIPISADLKLLSGDKVDVRIFGTSAGGTIVGNSGPWVAFNGHKHY